MQKRKRWSYRQYKSLDIAPGKFTIWIFATDRLGIAYSPGRSACAWEIRNEQGDVVDAPDPLVTAHEKSSQWRGYIAAGTRGIEKVPNHSIAIICSRHRAILQSIEAIDANRDRGWKNKQGKMLEDVDIFERFLLARDGSRLRLRKIQIETKLATSKLDEEIIERLKRDTTAALDKALNKKSRQGK